MVCIDEERWAQDLADIHVYHFAPGLGHRGRTSVKGLDALVLIMKPSG